MSADESQRRWWSHTGCTEANEQGLLTVLRVEASSSVSITQPATACVEGTSSVLRSGKRPGMNTTG